MIGLRYNRIGCGIPQFDWLNDLANRMGSNITSWHNVGFCGTYPC